MPDVSVVMSVYNGAGTLATTVESVLAQQDCAFEFIVIDDGSSDATAEILDEIAAHDSRLLVVHQPNTGLTRALIKGCAMARAEFIARQDCGDFALPDRLSAQAAHLRAHPQCAVVGSDYEVVGPMGERLKIHHGAYDGEADLPDRHGGFVCGPHHGTVMFRRDAYVAAGGYRDAFYFAQDVDLWTRLLAIGELEYVPQVLCRTVFDANGISGKHRGAQEALRVIILEAAAARRQGRSDADLVDRARAIRPQRGVPTSASSRRRTQAEASYFIGSCLFDQGDARSRRYLLDSIKLRPLQPGAWAKLLLSWLRAHDKGQSGT